MRAVVQRVLRASVTVEDGERGGCGPGLLLLVGVHRDDGEADAAALARRVANLRVFADDAGKMNRSLREIESSEPNVLAVSNFTVYADAGTSRRPSFSRAAPREAAERLFARFVGYLREEGLRVETGVFGADMRVELVNDGPVTLILDHGPREPS